MALVQSKGSSGGSTTLAVTFTASNVASGNTLVAYVSQDHNVTFTPSSVKDGAGNSFVQLGPTIDYPSSEGALSVWALNVPAGDVGTKPTITVTVSSTFGIAMVIEERSGIATSTTSAGFVDGTMGTKTGTTSPATSGTYSSSASSEDLVAAVGDAGYSATFTQTGYTADSNPAPSGNADLQVGYKSSSGGAESFSWAISGTSHWGSALFAFKTSGGGGTNASPTAGVANVTVAALNASVTIVGFPGVANVTVAALTPVTAVAAASGNASVTVAALAPALAAIAFPPVANVAVVALAPTAPIAFSTGVAGVTVVAPQLTPQVKALPSVGNVTVAAFNASATTTGNANASPGVANVTVAALAPTPRVTVLPPVTNVTVVSLTPTTTIAFTTGVANVAVAALTPAAKVTALPTVAPVTVAAFNATATNSGNITASAGVANVTVAALQPGVSISVTVVAGNAAVTVAALNASVSAAVPEVLVFTLRLLLGAWATRMDTSRWDAGGVGSAWIMDVDPSHWSMNATH
jgi:hypothetical protein